MLTEEENSFLTGVGPNTPGGDLLRRYWHPVAAVSEMDGPWTKRVRVLGEDLVLFKDRRGEFGLIAEACPHRRASLAFGIPQEDGIRCPYHGWKFDGTGRCVEQPNEPDDSTFKDKVWTAGYPVQVLAGLIFAYMGPQPAPLIPKFEAYVLEPALRLIGRAVVPCNWVQIMENSADPIHSEWLHGHLTNFLDEGNGKPKTTSRKHVKIAFDEVPYGIIKRRLKEGQSEDADDWKVGHPLVFPNILALGNIEPNWCLYQLQIRVPEDDTHTAYYWLSSFMPVNGMVFPQSLSERAHFYEVPLDTGLLDTAEFQDVMAWTTQGGITDRRLEHLGTTDAGVIMYRKMLVQQIKNVQAGQDPMLVNRDPAKDELLKLPIERSRVHYTEGFEWLLAHSNWRYSGITKELIELFGQRPERAAAG